jgi:SOS response regulatory protein OraA/RecX
MAVARELARKKAPSLKRLDSHTARRRLYGLLLRRGFNYEEIRPVVEEVLGAEEE